MNLTEEEVITLGYQNCRQLPDGTWIALKEFLFTYGLIYNIQQFSYERRWCYDKEDWAEAIQAYNNWDGEGKPPGPWVTEK